MIGSVAGDRGRQSNYVYGASKGGLEIFVQGLRNRLTPSGVGVLLVKPGFVDTPMTQHLKKNPLFAQPETIAAGIVAAMRRRKTRSTCRGSGAWSCRWCVCSGARVQTDEAVSSIRPFQSEIPLRRGVLYPKSIT